MLPDAPAAATLAALLRPKKRWRPLPDLGGKTFERLTALRKVGPGLWACRCHCGADLVAQGSALVRGKVKSCGCFRADRMRAFGKARLQHGRGGSPEYFAWFNMNRRHAGLVCSRWRDSFASFVADLGPRPSSKHKITRFERAGFFTPKNVAWAVPHQRFIGARFGRLVVLERAPGRWTRWKCRCDCGRETIANAFDIRSGKTTSCGCRLAENNRNFGQRRGSKKKIEIAPTEPRPLCFARPVVPRDAPRRARAYVGSADVDCAAVGFEQEDEERRRYLDRMLSEEPRGESRRGGRLGRTGFGKTGRKSRPLDAEVENEIRRLYAAGGATYLELAARFSLNKTRIRNVIVSAPVPQTSAL